MTPFGQQAGRWWCLALAALLSNWALAGEAILDAPAAHQLTRAGKALLIDVRTLEEWQETGVPEGALTVALQDPDLLRKVMLAADRDPGRPLLVICRTGRRSAIAADLFRRAGFLSVINVAEGVAGRRGVGPGWIARGLPMDTYDAARHAPTPIDPNAP